MAVGHHSEEDDFGILSRRKTAQDCRHLREDRLTEVDELICYVCIVSVVADKYSKANNGPSYRPFVAVVFCWWEGFDGGRDLRQWA